jgi:hypothetical protein
VGCAPRASSARPSASISHSHFQPAATPCHSCHAACLLALCSCSLLSPRFLHPSSFLSQLLMASDYIDLDRVVSISIWGCHYVQAKPKMFRSPSTRRKREFEKRILRTDDFHTGVFRMSLGRHTQPESV